MTPGPDADTLFDLDPVPGASVARLSPGRRLTARQHERIDAGIHPLTNGPTDPNPYRRCGNCLHRVQVPGGGRSWPKCDADNGRRITHGSATDVRASWPACASGYQPLQPAGP